MIWHDVINNRILSKEEIKKGLCTIFPVKVNEILVVDNIDSIQGSLSEDIRILCQTWLSKAELPFSVSIYLRDQSLIAIENKLQHDVDKIGIFCETLICEALIGDESVNPNSWLLIRSRVDYRQTFINLDLYDCREPYETNNK